MILQQLDQIEWRRHSHAQRIGKLLIRALVDTSHDRQRVINNDINMTILLQNLLHKGLEHLLLRDVSYIVVTLLLVNHAYYSSFFTELISHTLANTLRSTSHDDNLILEIHPIHYLNCILFLSSVGETPSLFRKNRVKWLA